MSDQEMRRRFIPTFIAGSIFSAESPHAITNRDIDRVKRCGDRLFNPKLFELPIKGIP